MNKKMFTLLFCISIVVSTAFGKSGDSDAIKRAVLDYVEAAYEMKPENIKRSVHPTLCKIGFYLKEGKYHESRLTYDQLLKLVTVWNKKGRATASSQKKVEILDVMDQTACAKLTAVWGIDYIHLAKFNGKWKIIHVIWQSLPQKKTGSGS